MASTYFITGAAGFIGSHLARALVARGDRVIGIDNFDPFYERSIKIGNLTTLDCPEFTFVEADIRDCDTMNSVFAEHRPDGVFHLAALAGVRPSIANPAAYASVNVDGLVTVLEAARHGGCGRVVFASSSSVYGNNSKTPFSEVDEVAEPISPYAATKRAGELLCHTYCHLFDMRICALRFFTVYGPSQRPDLAISKFMGRIARNEPIEMFGNGDTSRDYTYINDIIAGTVAADQRAASGDGDAFRIYNLGGSTPIKLNDMIRQIGQVVGREPVIEHKPMMPGDVNHTWADLSRSQAELGYVVTTPFQEGLRRQWEWMQTAMPEIIGA